MGFRSKLARLSEFATRMRRTGWREAYQTSLNRYRYDHSVSAQLPVVTPAYPYHIQIETSRVCNLRCKMCEYTFMSNKGTILRLQPFQTILDQFPAVQSIDLTGIGEPFCNPDFLKILAYAKQRGLYVEFANNGNLLTDERIEALIELGIDNTQFSVDASTHETHESVRAWSDFDRVQSAIRKLCAGIRESGRTDMEVRLTFTMSRENIAEAPAFVGLARSLGVGAVIFRDLIVFEGSGYGAEDKVTTLDIAQLKEIRDRIFEQAKVHQVDVTVDTALDSVLPGWQICRRPWNSVFVDVYGNLYPCCLVTQRNNDTTQYAIGNLFLTPFTELWNGAEYQTLRREMAHPTAIPSVCEGCRYVHKETSSLVQLGTAPTTVAT
jgi:radical SAM protein with 4Fe4S-binding SPASM domain